MDENYTQTLLRELDQKIKETEMLLSDPDMAEMAKLELEELNRQRASLLTQEQTVNETSDDDLDQRNVIMQFSGAAGGGGGQKGGGEGL